MPLFSTLAGRRIPYDSDGTAVFRKTELNLWQEFPPFHRSAISEDDYRAVSFTAGFASTTELLFLFPYALDLSGVFFCVSYDRWENTVGDDFPLRMLYSTDTTNGDDGTWSSVTLSDGFVPSDHLYYSNEYSLFRLSDPGDNRTSESQLKTYPLVTSPYSFFNVGELSPVLSSVNGVRLLIGVDGNLPEFSSSVSYLVYVSLVQLYGELSSVSSVDRVVPWDSASGSELPSSISYFGNSSLLTSDNIQFKLKNLSSSKTADSIVVSLSDTPRDYSRSIRDQFSLKYGSSDEELIQISSLSPGDVSDVITVSRDTPLDSLLSPFSTPLRIHVGEWS